MEIFLFIVAGIAIYFVVKAWSSSTTVVPQIMPFEIRLQDVQVEPADRDIPAKEIQARGAFPLKETKNIAAWISLLDESTEQPLPVMCVIDQLQEDDSPAYFMKAEFGIVGPNHAISDWAQIGAVFPEILQPPYGGQRTLTVVVRLVDSFEPPRMRFGYLPDETGLLWTGKIKFTHHFDEKGYTEIAAHRKESQILTLKIAMAMAMSDGSLDKKEGELMRQWVKRSIRSSSGEEDSRMKEIFNQTLRESNAEAKEGSLSLQPLASRLNDIGETSGKYQAFELASQIMAADHKADPSEIKALSDLAEWLGLDNKRVTEMMDASFVQLDLNISTSVEDLLGIKLDWSDERVKKYLTSEFSKWNSRLNTLPEGKERDNVQCLLERIAAARKKN